MKLTFATGTWLLACFSLVACSSLLDLDALSRVDCLDACTDGGSAGASRPGNAGGPSIGAGTTSGGAPTGSAGSSGKSNAGGSASGGSSQATAGSTATGSGGSSAGAGGSAGLAGSAGSSELAPCPGGAAPPSTWQEHWFEHDQLVTLDQYDDCVAVYVDRDMAHADAAWIAAFLSQAWRYSLEQYGELGDDRLFGVLHLGHYPGGHSSAYFETSHDSRNVIDAGATAWPADDYDLPAHLLSFVVERTASHAKQGSVASSVWHDDGFAQIFKYDLYVGLGMTDEAAKAYDAFSPTSFPYPVPNSYWFADWYYPVWRDHGGSSLLVRFFALLEQHYPSVAQATEPMTWGEYVHFMSGAAGADLQEQAIYAFGWTNEWQAQLEQARVDYPQLVYPR